MTYIPGDYYFACERCGRKYRKSVMKKTWNNLWCCPADWEERHPQEFVRGLVDTIAVPVARPWGTDTFLTDSITDVADILSPPTVTNPEITGGPSSSTKYLYFGSDKLVFGDEEVILDGAD